MLQDAMKDRFRSLQSLSADDLLEALGLQRRRSLFETTLVPSVAMFAAGAVVGAAAAVLLTPKTGPAMRRELSEGARDLGQRITQGASSVVQEVANALPLGEAETTTRASGQGGNHTRRAST
jgi:hypothetical protein